MQQSSNIEQPEIQARGVEASTKVASEPLAPSELVTVQPLTEEQQALKNIAEALQIPQMQQAIVAIGKRLDEKGVGGKGNPIMGFFETPFGQGLAKMGTDFLQKYLSGGASGPGVTIKQELVDKITTIALAREERLKIASDKLVAILDGGGTVEQSKTGEIRITPGVKEEKKT